MDAPNTEHLDRVATLWRGTGNDHWRFVSLASSWIKAARRAPGQTLIDACASQLLAEIGWERIMAAWEYIEQSDQPVHP